MDDLNIEDKNKLFKMLIESETPTAFHLDDAKAKNLVAVMYHMSNGKEVHDRYAGVIPTSTPIAEVYMAINTMTIMSYIKYGLVIM